jgi:predicted permease
MLADLKFALRQLRRSPGFAFTAVLTLALGIGANTAIFSLVDSIILRPMPYAHQGRLVRISGFLPKGWIRELQNRSQTFSAISGYDRDIESNVAGPEAAERVFGTGVTVNTFDTLGLHPAVGRFFLPDEATAGRDLVVVLSYGYWRQHFGGNPDVVGQSVRIDGISRRIIGVMPSGVHFPYADTQFVVPISFKGGDPIDPWNYFELRALGRLKDGVTPLQAQADLRRLHPILLPLFPWTMPDSWEADTTVVPLLDSVVGDTRPRLLLLFGAVGLILLIACANVANLMLARASGREREMAIRGALGASGWRLIRQLLLESALLGAFAGVVGVIAAAASLRALARILPADTPRLASLGLHWDVFLFAGAASLITSILFGLVPALKMASPNLQDTLHSGGRGVAGKASQFRVAMLLVIGQIGLSVVVLTAAGLMLHSLYTLWRVDPGFRTDRLVTAEVSLDATACKQPGHCGAFFHDLEDRARGIEGVSGAALTDALPMSGWDLNYFYDAEGNTRDPKQPAKQGSARTVSPNYFSTLGLRLVRGRLLADSDATGASRAVVINRKMAQDLWPNQDPLGKHVVALSDEQSPAVIDPNVASIVVGVVSNTHHDSLDGTFDDEVYLPMTRSHEAPVMYVVMRTQTGAAQAAGGLRQAVATLNPLVPVTRVRTLNEVVAASASAPRSLTILLLGFGALAVVIGIIGVYSLIAYIVSWRTREIGIRLALGAPRGRIIFGVVKQSLLLACGGSLVGLAAAAMTTRVLRSFLFEVSVLDPLTFCAVPVLIALLALAAAWIPARRAASVDPIEALRQE